MLHETKNLVLDEDGDVWLRFLDDDGEQDIELVGPVDSCHLRLDDDDELYNEAEEIQAAWKDSVCDRRHYEAGHGSFWGR
jgi:hypothetical protein